MLSVGIVPIHESTYGDVDGYNAASMLAPSTTKKQSNAYLLMRHRSASTEISMLVGSDKRERSAMPTIKIRIMLYDDLSTSELLPLYMNERRAMNTSSTLALEVVHRLLRCSQPSILDYTFFPA
jgi:hypothetical protein